MFRGPLLPETRRKQARPFKTRIAYSHRLASLLEHIDSYGLTSYRYQVRRHRDVYYPLSGILLQK